MDLITELAIRLISGVETKERIQSLITMHNRGHVEISIVVEGVPIDKSVIEAALNEMLEARMPQIELTEMPMPPKRTANQTSPSVFPCQRVSPKPVANSRM